MIEPQELLKYTAKIGENEISFNDEYTIMHRDKDLYISLQDEKENIVFLVYGVYRWKQAEAGLRFHCNTVNIEKNYRVLLWYTYILRGV